MKKLLISAAFVAMLATPALAQSYNPDFGGANVDAPYASIYGGQRNGDNAYAYAPRARSHSGRHANASVDSWVQRENLNIPFEDHREDREY